MCLLNIHRFAHIALTALLVTLLSSSCQHLDDKGQVAPQPAQYTVVDGMVKFDSWDSYKTFMESASKKVKPEYGAIISGDFTSLYEMRDMGRQSETDTSLHNTPLADNLLSAIVSPKREVGIGADSIYALFNDYCFVYSKENGTLVDQFMKEDADHPNRVQPGKTAMFFGGKLKVYGTVLEEKVIRFSVDSTSKGGRRGSLDQYYNFDATHRMKGSFYKTSYVIYTKIGVRTTMQQYATKFLWFKGWKDDNASKLSVRLIKGTFSLKDGGLYAPFPARPGYVEETNRAEADYRAEYYWGGTDSSLDWQSGHAQHTVWRDTFGLGFAFATTIDTYY